MIAATVPVYGAEAIATCNLNDFADCGISLIDPLAGSAPS